jgi:hypothetical protein
VVVVCTGIRYPSLSLSHLQPQLGSAPVPALGVPLDGVPRPHPDPLGQRPVLALLLGQGALGPEGLLGRLDYKSSAEEGERTGRASVSKLNTGTART